MHTDAGHRLSDGWDLDTTGHACSLNRLPLLLPLTHVQAGLALARAPVLYISPSFVSSLLNYACTHNTEAIPVRSVLSYAWVRKTYPMGLAALRSFQLVEKTDIKEDNTFSGRHREAVAHDKSSQGRLLQKGDPDIGS